MACHSPCAAAGKPYHKPLASTQVLASEIAHYLGMDLGKIKTKRFADGEIYVQVQVSRGQRMRWVR